MTLLPDPGARDLRGTASFEHTADYLAAAYAGGSARPVSATSAAAFRDGRSIAFVGHLLPALDTPQQPRLFVADDDGVRRLTDADAEELDPRVCPDGSTIAFRSDAGTSGVYQLAFLDLASGRVRRPNRVDGTVEYLHWSPDGTRVLLGVAGLGAHAAGGQGSGAIAPTSDGPVPAWTPQVDRGAGHDQRRSLWVHDVASGESRRVSTDLNVWEAVWCGSSAVAALVSAGASESDWYDAELHRMSLVERGDGRESLVLHVSARQLGVPTASPDGRRVAVVEAWIAARTVAAGDVLLIDTSDGDESSVARIETLGVDVTQLTWLDPHRLAFVGQRGLETVAGVHDLRTGLSLETWVSDMTCGDRYPEASFLPDGSAAIVHHGYTRPPELAWLRADGVHVVASLRNDQTERVIAGAGTLQSVSWSAPDGWEIQGLLATPAGPGPHPLVVYAHGGPIWAYRNRWMMGHVHTPLLVSHGYAVLHPNPRGSSGRGQDFSGAVVGDLGGVDTHDFLSGIDALVERGVADADRIGVMGGSYGGFMSAWLVTQDTRFAAAVPMSPVTNWYTQHHTANHPAFDQLFMGADPHVPGGRYHERSPVMHASRVRTPVLHMSGDQDFCTPPIHSIEFHHELVIAGVLSVCVVYPGEGHGVRGFPALIDQCTRIVDWFARHMPAHS
ncbi:S9 family peptidase [Aeromicrobium sp. PE09-221]|uniref:S9 family peptidase n=1 Tax=Aeromicrobium sp. PE09-221 TaxID=1898043 RepID=UPI000B3E5784|nr:prolyl oligopeptidase family serine peptidase [Aeromicrobium sp. PE09-221]OUZ12416.1 S9 family peptidase [Aeromicrobium sp. PE09-221]